MARPHRNLLNTDPVDMDYFDKRMALDVIEDALTALGAPENRGMALGLCAAFYMSGLLSHSEWEAFLDRIPGGMVPGKPM